MKSRLSAKKTQAKVA